MAKAFGIITSPSNRYYVEGLQDYRPIAAFSFVGRYRIIDFPISSMSNSGIEHIFVYTSGNPRSLTEHLGSGRLYNINSKRGKLQLLFHDAGSVNRIYNTDIAAFYENLEHIERTTEEYVIVAPSNFIYTEHYDELLSQHIESGADVSLLFQRVDDANEHYLGCRTLNINRQKGVAAIEINMGNEKGRNIFLDTYVMKKEVLLALIARAKRLSSMYTLSQMLSLSCDELDVRAIPHKGFMAAITDFRSYYDANLALIDQKNAASLFDPSWPVYTRTTDSCPAQFFEGASAKGSLVSNGCTIEGTIENSVLGRGIHVGKGAVIRNSVILSYAEIGENVRIENEVVDKWAKIIHAKEVAADPDHPGYVKRNDTL